MSRQVITEVGYCLRCKTHKNSESFKNLFRTGYYAFKNAYCAMGICKCCKGRETSGTQVHMLAVSK